MFKSINPVKRPQFEVLGLFALVALVFMLIWGRLPQNDSTAYFSFADDRCILGVDNFADVISNLGFALVGLFGLYKIKKLNAFISTEEKIICFSLSLSLLLVTIGSAYFHYYPTPERLFWDRVPMVFAFISMNCLLISDRIQKEIALKTLIVMLPLAVLVLTLWRLQFLNLKPYLTIQFGSLLFILFICGFKRFGELKNWQVITAFLFYILAKVVEKNDHQIYQVTLTTISGHTIKHLLAALSVGVILFFFKRNKPQLLT